MLVENGSSLALVIDSIIALILVVRQSLEMRSNTKHAFSFDFALQQIYYHIICEILFVLRSPDLHPSRSLKNV